MLHSIDPISVDSVAFLALSGILMSLAWSRAKRFFLPCLASAGAIMAVSWLGWKDFAALAVFLIAPYLVARAIWGQKKKDTSALVAGLIIWQLALFVIFKRYPWFDVLGWVEHPVTVIGLSYIFFRQLHLVIDARFFGHLRFGFVRYIGFILSPWTLLAGPIQRYDAFCTGIDKLKRPETSELLGGAHRVINGLLLAFVFAPIFLEPSHIGNLGHPDADWTDFVVVFYGFPIYLYLNFAGYTDIMIGTARLCGFDTLPENFNRPYLAQNTRDFWARWHMSFGAWIKTYVFTPVCARLMKSTQPKYHWLMMLIAVLLAFYVVGIWHGTTINYLIFGMVQGFGVITSALFEHARKRAMGAKQSREFNNVFWFKSLSIITTFHYTCLSFLLLNDHPDRLFEAISTFFG